tara:strand:+ start:2890 stop:4218 length:1329 start_codon:yes stop_codon:yes gene_type:complete
LDELTAELDEEEPKTNEEYGSSCPDTEVMQICLNSWSYWFGATTWGGISDPDGTEQCMVETPNQYFPKEIDIVIKRESEDRCVWKNTERRHVKGYVNGGQLVSPANKPCFKYTCCTEIDGSWKYYESKYSDMITMGFDIDDVELRITPFCIEDESYAQHLRHPIGTCGRLVEVKVHFYFNDESNDAPTCGGPYPHGTCLEGSNFFGLANCPRIYEGAPEMLWNFRGGVQQQAWFFPSCGCMPYCWVDEKCEECGDFLELDDDGNPIDDSLGCFLKTDSPVVSYDVLGRDRLCNAKDCGCWGCCADRLGDGHTVGSCRRCVAPDDDTWTGAVGESNCGDYKYSGFSDRCGRGGSYGVHQDSGISARLLVSSHSYDPDSEATNYCPEDAYEGCCGRLTAGMGNCGNLAEWSSSWSGHPHTMPWESIAQKSKGFEMNWRIIPNYS